VGSFIVFEENTELTRFLTLITFFGEKAGFLRLDFTIVIKHIALSRNMRLNTCSSSVEWEQCLRQIGNGQYPSEIIN